MTLQLRSIALLIMMATALAGCHTTSLGKAVGYPPPPGRGMGQ